MTEKQVLYETDGKVGIVTLNRPNKLNALSMELRLEMERVLRAADDEAATSVIVLRSEGRSFCVGFDVGGRRLRSRQGAVAVRCAEASPAARHQRAHPDDALDAAEAGDRLGAGTLPGRRMRACDVLRSDDRRRQCGVRRAGDPVLASRSGAADADDHRTQARPRAPLFRRHHRREDRARLGAWSTASCRLPSFAPRP